MTQFCGETFDEFNIWLKNPFFVPQCSGKKFGLMTQCCAETLGRTYGKKKAFMTQFFKKTFDLMTQG